MKKYYLLFGFLLTIFTLSAQNNIVSYVYDNAGNRISRKIVNLDVTPNPIHIKKDSIAPTPVEEQLGERRITVFPNATKGALAEEITCGETKPAMPAGDPFRIILFRAQGTQLQNIKVEAGKTPINMIAYPAGWYI
jgi:hypothetical protein